MVKAKCGSCGSVLTKREDFEMSFELVWKTDEIPEKIIFHVLCGKCLTELKAEERRGIEAWEFFKKLSRIYCR